jgi:hypothetical protein
MKMTKWFPGDVKPVHVGVYETAPMHGIQFFQFWNGQSWGYAAQDPEMAREWSDMPSFHQNDSWRGLAKEAE